MFTQIQLQKYPLMAEIFHRLESDYPLYKNTYQYLAANFDENYLAFGQNIICALCQKNGTSKNLGRSLKAFIKYSHEYLVLQAKLNSSGKYLYSSFDDINAKIYQNSATMEQYYLDGLLLSQILWPNHYKMGQYFLNLKNSNPSQVLEVPSGSGIYAYYISKYFKYDSLFSCDISPFACAYAKDFLKAAGSPIDNIQIKTQNIFDLRSGNFDLIVCGELLEHIQNPRLMLAKLASLVNDNGTVFLTTAIFAAAIDHLYLFENVAQVRDILKNDFDIVSELILPVNLVKFEPAMNRVPINYACILKKNGKNK